MTADARVGAFIHAWQRLEALQELRNKIGESTEVPLIVEMPPAYWAILAEANVCAMLTQTTSDVGLLADEWMASQAERKRKAEVMEDQIHRVFEDLNREAEKLHKDDDEASP